MTQPSTYHFLTYQRLNNLILIFTAAILIKIGYFVILFLIRANFNFTKFSFQEDSYCLNFNFLKYLQYPNYIPHQIIFGTPSE